jgi:Uma2 family endonuclease
MITDINQLDTSKLYSYSDYLLWQFEERIELLKGKLLRMSPAPSRKHQDISVLLLNKIFNSLENNTCKVYSAPFDVRLPISEDLDVSKKYKNKAKKLPDGKMMTVLQPDICVICDIDKLDERGCVGAPDLIIEILSPGNTQKEMKDKFEIYQEAGVREYWMVETLSEFILKYTLVDDIFVGSKPYTNKEQIKSEVLSGFVLDVGSIFK